MRQVEHFAVKSPCAITEWYSPSSKELANLFDKNEPQLYREPEIQLFSIPPRLLRSFNGLGRQELEKEKHGTPSALKATELIDELVDFFNFVRAPVRDACAVRLDYGFMENKPLSTFSLRENAPNKVQAHIGAFINVGSEACKLIYSLYSSIDHCVTYTEDHCHDDGIILVGLVLYPGEGYFADLQKLQHWICWGEHSYETCILSIRPGKHILHDGHNDENDLS